MLWSYTAQDTRQCARPPLVKFAVPSLEGKIAVLRAKRNLKQSAEFPRVFLRSSKSHTERLIEPNFKKMLDLIPGGENMRVAGSGRLVDRKGNYDESSHQHDRCMDV